jgi:hypothetical protein
MNLDDIYNDPEYLTLAIRAHESYLALFLLEEELIELAKQEAEEEGELWKMEVSETSVAEKILYYREELERLITAYEKDGTRIWIPEIDRIPFNEEHIDALATVARESLKQTNAIGKEAIRRIVKANPDNPYAEEARKFLAED